ncbi:MAG: hypothetical protein AAGB29_06535 [Planctomycetota bacterium]
MTAIEQGKAPRDAEVVFLNPLIWLLGGAEQQKGEYLTEQEVLDVRDETVCLLMPKSQASAFQATMAAQAPVPQIDPEQVWPQWLQVRDRKQEFMPEDWQG